MQLILPAEVGQLRTFWLTTSRKNASIFILVLLTQLQWDISVQLEAVFPQKPVIWNSFIKPHTWRSYFSMLLYAFSSLTSRQIPLSTKSFSSSVCSLQQDSLCSCVIMFFDFPSIYNKLESSLPKSWINPAVTKMITRLVLSDGWLHKAENRGEPPEKTRRVVANPWCADTNASYSVSSGVHKQGCSPIPGFS